MKQKLLCKPIQISFAFDMYPHRRRRSNGLRPSRYYVTRDNVVVMASEVGVYDIDPADIVHKVKEETFSSSTYSPDGE